jgi:Peptidase family M28
MRVVLFDLGETLEHEGTLIPGAREVLEAVSALRDGDGEPVVLALAPGDDSATRPGNVKAARRAYAKVLRDLGILDLFQPLDRRATLSVEVGATRSDPRGLRAAVDRVAPGLPLHHAMLVTADGHRVRSARRRGMPAIQVRAPGKRRGKVLADLLPLLERWAAFPSHRRDPRKGRALRASLAMHGKAAEPTVQALVDQVDAARLEASVRALAGFGTRSSLSPGIRQVTQWIHDQFTGLGFAAGTEVEFQPFTLPEAGPQRNVLCRDGATGQEIVLVCAHYDSIAKDSDVQAPGADDNATGVAALLELARILRPVALGRQVLFAAFGAEEQRGFAGSTTCAEKAVAEGWPIHAVINLDMIGCNPIRPDHVVVEYDQGGRSDNDAAALALGKTMEQAMLDYTTLKVDTADIVDSDYIPFEERGFACIGAYDEGQDSDHYHRSTDLPDTLDFPYLTEVVKGVLATVFLLAR